MTMHFLDEDTEVWVEVSGPAQLRIFAPGMPPAALAAVLERLELGRLRDYDEAELDMTRLQDLTIKLHEAVEDQERILVSVSY
jgi:hypothetical protein